MKHLRRSRTPQLDAKLSPGVSVTGRQLAAMAAINRAATAVARSEEARVLANERLVAELQRIYNDVPAAIMGRSRRVRRKA